MEMRPRPQAPPAAALRAQATSFSTARHYSSPLRLPLSPAFLRAPLSRPPLFFTVFTPLLASPLPSGLLASISGLPYTRRPLHGVCPPHFLLAVFFGTLPLPFTSAVRPLPHTALSGQRTDLQGKPARQTECRDFIILVNLPLQFLP